MLRGLTRHHPDHRYLLYTPHTDPGLDPGFPVAEPSAGAAPEDGAPGARVALPPAWSRSGPAAALWRTWSLGRRAARDGVALFHGLSQELPRDLPRQIPAVVSIADLLPLRHPEFFPPIDRRTYQWKTRHAAERADLIIALSRQTAHDLATRYQVDPARIRVIGMGTHPRFAGGPDPAGVARVRDRYQLPDGYALMVGRLEDRKNARLAVEALALLPADRRPLLVLAGQPTRDTARLDDLIRARRLESGVRRLGPVAAPDLPPLYQGAGVFLYPSLFEGFGIPILEAFRSDTPVITSTGGPFDEVGGDAAWAVDPRAPEALAEAIDTVLTDRARAEGMRARGRVQAARFAEATLAGQLRDVYRELLP